MNQGTGRWQRIGAWITAGALSFAGWMQTAQAQLIGAQEVVQSTATTADLQSQRSQVESLLARADVVERLAAYGVDATQAQARAAALTDEEVAYLAAHMDQAPAGGVDVIGTLVFLFVLLLITDILGLTKIFPFTRSVR